MDTLTPKEIVAQLDNYIIGQTDAKKAVAIALYNRYRRLQVPEKLQQEITPKNLMMIGPTGVGKTEIARRLAKIVNAPFVKVEATKFTEVGYVGRDVESMVRDLVSVAVSMVEKEKIDEIRPDVRRDVDKKLVKLLAPGVKKEQKQNNQNDFMSMLNNMQNGQNLGSIFNNADTVDEDLASQEGLLFWLPLVIRSAAWICQNKQNKTQKGVAASCNFCVAFLSNTGCCFELLI